MRSQVLRFKEQEIAAASSARRANRVIVVCATCRLQLCSFEDRIEVKGSHDHTFSNPVGRIFPLRCFSRAAGCQQVGLPTQEFTWFPGCSWTLLHCRGCVSHLGWHYSGPLNFDGLITFRVKDMEVKNV